MGGRAKDDERTWERNHAIWRAYLRGKTQEEIGRQHGLTQSRVSEIIRQVRDNTPQETRDEVVRREAAFLDSLRDTVMDLFEAPLPPAFDKDGNPLVDPDTDEIVRDGTPRLTAFNALVKTMERHAKLLGIDAPTKLEQAVTVNEDAAAATLAQEAAARLAESNG